MKREKIKISGTDRRRVRDEKRKDRNIGYQKEQST